MRKISLSLVILLSIMTLVFGGSTVANASSHAVPCPQSPTYSLNTNSLGNNPPPYVQAWWHAGFNRCGWLVNAKGRFCNSHNCVTAYGLWRYAYDVRSQATGPIADHLTEAWVQLKKNGTHCKAEVYPTPGPFKC